MATLYQVHSTMDSLKRCVDQMSRTWCTGDSILLLGNTVAFIDWFSTHLGVAEIKGVAGYYARAEDISQLTANTTLKLDIETKLSLVLTDHEWVELTQDPRFDKVMTIAL